VRFSKLNTYQKIAGLLFLLAKASNIVALVFILLMIQSKEWTIYAQIFLLVGGFSLMFCIGTAVYEHITRKERKEDQAKKILEDKELLKMIENMKS